MKEFVFATNNSHKLTEIRPLLQHTCRIISLSEIGCQDDIPETAMTIDGNARLKAEYIYHKFGKNCFADDTGLEIDTLDGRPGVFSARYAGEHCTFDDNVRKVLHEMQGKKHRNARFRTVICLIEDGKTIYFEGVCRGTILTAPTGKEGFGYDPIFQPENATVSFAEMDLNTKNKISHRGKAVEQLIQYLNHA